MTGGWGESVREGSVTRWERMCVRVQDTLEKTGAKGAPKVGALSWQGSVRIRQKHQAGFGTTNRPWCVGQGRRKPPYMTWASDGGGTVCFWPLVSCVLWWFCSSC